MAKKDKLEEAPAKVSEEKKTVEEWQSIKKAPDWIYEASRAQWRFIVGWELTEKEFEAALERAANTEYK